MFVSCVLIDCAASRLCSALQVVRVDSAVFVMRFDRDFPQGQILEHEKPKEDNRNDAPMLPTRPDAEDRQAVPSPKLGYLFEAKANF